MTRPFLEVQKELQDFMLENCETIEAYQAERDVALDEVSDETFAAKCLDEIQSKYFSVMSRLWALQAEREAAYHELKLIRNKKKSPKLDGTHFRSLIDINHPNSPYGERLDRPEDWKPNSREYGPGGMMPSGGKIISIGG
jgi:hypothetical protein